MWNSKPKKRGHDCRKRKHGNPKIGTGTCQYGMRRAVRERIRGKAIVRRLLRDPDDE